MTKQIRFFGRDVMLVCDGRCDKAWGINGRTRLYFMESAETPRALKQGEEPRDPDDMVYVSDDDLGTAPGNTGSWEGGHGKPSEEPLADASQMNKWCARECERSCIVEPGERVAIRNLRKPEPNIPRSTR